jgi:UDP-GlcNAc:undecaprenyl-phosphate GlcNAc-1-phosphate transferase
MLAAIVVTSFGLRLHWIRNPVLDQGLTIFWVIGITNALNLLDNIYGAAAGIAAIGALYLVYFGHATHHPDAARLAASFAGAVVGFLVFNVNPASIFMGDCGSLFIGFFLAGLTLVDARVEGARRNLLAVLTVPVLLLLMPILDTSLVTIMRHYHGRRVSQGGRDHTSHRLVALGMSERSATFTLWTIAAAAGGLAVLVRSASMAVAGFLICIFGLGILFLAIFLGHVKVYEPVASGPHGRASRALLPTLADLSNKGRIFETLNDLVLIFLAYYAAFLLRFEFRADPGLIGRFIQSLPLVLMTQLSVFVAMGLYQGLWRYTGMADLNRIVRSVGVAVGCSTVVLLLVFRFEGISRAALAIDGALLLLGVAGSRVAFRMLRDSIVQRASDAKRVVIYGAGDAGELLLRELKSNTRLGMVAVGFVDDDPLKAGRMIHGVPVIGVSSDMQKILATAKAQLVVVSTNKIKPERAALVARTCQETSVDYRTMRIAFE